jgi:hypothetical protein
MSLVEKEIQKLQEEKSTSNLAQNKLMQEY